MSVNENSGPKGAIGPEAAALLMLAGISSTSKLGRSGQSAGLLEKTASVAISAGSDVGEWTCDARIR